jgi:uncharacterized membrane protein HdeD (DUF308 family)
MLGILILFAGAGQIVSAFSSGRWSGVFVHIVLGLLYGVTGFLILENPLPGAAGVTLLLAAFLERFPTWGWTLLNGAVTLLLGIIIWRQFPESALWVIGLLVGIDLIFAGWASIMLALAVRGVAEPKSSKV